MLSFPSKFKCTIRYSALNVAAQSSSWAGTAISTTSRNSPSAMKKRIVLRNYYIFPSLCTFIFLFSFLWLFCLLQTFILIPLRVYSRSVNECYWMFTLIMIYDEKYNYRVLDAAVSFTHFHHFHPVAVEASSIGLHFVCAMIIRISSQTCPFRLFRTFQDNREISRRGERENIFFCN